jgi:hypothetical protein
LVLSETSAAQKIAIDSDTLTVKPGSSILLAQTNGHWQVADPAADTGLRKKHNLQGPINDAFLDSFMCITPVVQGAVPLIQKRNADEIARFERLIAKEYRGAVRMKNGDSMTAEDIVANNLILFGDKGSNPVIRQIADKLPIKWEGANIVVGGKTYSATDHVLAMIYPNPLNPNRYIVLNTGLVAPGSGVATGYGDYAILKVSQGENGSIGTEVVDGGNFDENWNLPK